MPHSEAQLAVFYYKLAIREIERARRGQVRIVILLRYGATGKGARRAIRRVTGSEIVSVWLVFRGRQYRLSLSAPHAIVLHYLCWHCSGGIGQSAAEIEAGLNEQLFYVHHASSAKRRGAVLARASRTNIRKIIERVRGIMADLFFQEHLPLDPSVILRSEPTSTREVRYSIWADVHFEG